MKRKTWRVVGIVFGILLVLFILIGPAVPLWEKLGLKPICIEGNWPRFRIVSCPSAQSPVTPIPIPNLNGQSPIPIIVDDDGSPDGMIALLYFLANPRFDIRAVTISYGEAHPDLFAPHVMQLLAELERTDIPVGAGRGNPLAGDNAFPDPWRQASDRFWDVDLPSTPMIQRPASAAELMVETINYSPQPVVLFISGAHTNLAEALRLDPVIAQNIQDIYIMGGSVNVPGNIHSDWPEYNNTVAEWNIWADPVAADEVFSAGLPLHLVPLDATQQVVWTPSDLSGWEAGEKPESNLASELLKWMLNSWSEKGVYVWDLVAAVQATNSAVCPEVPKALDILTAPGPEQGRVVVENTAANVGVCLEPDAGQIKALVASVFGDR